MQLTQKEKSLLKDALSHEEVCIRKYQEYAAKVGDPGLQQMFNTHASHEQKHYDTINSLFQGQGAGQTQAKTGASFSYGAIGGSTMSTGAKGSKEDEMLCHDMLMTEKYISGTYDTGVFESANSEVRQALQHIQQEEQQHGEHIFQYMQQHGMYNAK